MEVSEVNGQLCVELDAGSIFTNYMNHIDEVAAENVTVQNDLESVMYVEASKSATDGSIDSFKEGDLILAKNKNTNIISAFSLPTPNSFGYC